MKPKSCFKGNKLRVEFGYLLELGWVGLLWDQLRSDRVPNDLRLAGSEFSMHTYLVEFNSSAGQSQCPVTRPGTTVPPFQLERGIWETRSHPQPF